MAVSVEDIKGVLYLDGDEDDALIKSYIDAALQFVKGAVGTEHPDFWNDPQVTPLADMATKSLAATYYQYRLSLSDTQTFSVNLTVNSIIGQLRGLYDLKEVAANAAGD